MKDNNLTLAKTHDSCESGDEKLTVVLIHGIASDSNTYNKALTYFDSIEDLKDVRFVTFDLLGSGESTKDDSLNYDYDDQLEALHNSITELDVKSPLVLVGHSLGTFIVTRYASIYKDEVSKLVLVSPPIYSAQDFAHPDFQKGIDGFIDSVRAKNPDIVEKKSFKNSMSNIVLDQSNYDVLASLDLPIIIIYGDEDKTISSYNIPGMLKANKNITAIKTVGRHSVSEDKYTELAKVLSESINA